MIYNKRWIDKARKDLIVVLGNIKRVRTERDKNEATEAIRGYYRRVIGTKIFADDPGGHGTLMDVVHRIRAFRDEVAYNNWIHERISAPLAALNDHLTAILWESSSPYYTVDEWRAMGLKHKEKALVAARKLWAMLETFTKQRPDLFFSPDRETPTRIAGFDVVLVDYDPSEDRRYDRSRDWLEQWTEALTRFRRQALEVMPVMVAKAVPFYLRFHTNSSLAGRYVMGREGFDTHIDLFVRTARIDENVMVVAHEMGHHLYRTHLSAAARADWEATIRGRRAELSIREIVDRWPSRDGREVWAYDMSRYLKDDPILALRIEGIAQRLGYQKKSEFEELLDRGDTTLDVPETPITGYAEKNAEEAFCETVALMVGYGTGAVHPRVRHWLDVVVGKDVRFGRTAGRRRKVATRLRSAS